MPAYMSRAWPDLVGGEFEFLCDIALQQPDLDGIAVGTGPVDVEENASGAEGQADDGEHGRQRGFPAFASDVEKEGDGAGYDGGDERDAIDTGDRSVSGQRAGGVGISGHEPGQSGDDPAAHPFGENPEGREDEDGGDAQAGLPAFHEEPGEKAGESGKDSQKEGEADDGGSGQKGGHAAVGVHADVEPVQTGDQAGGSVGPAGVKGGTCPFGVQYSRDQDGQAGDLERPEAEGGESEGGYRAGEKGDGGEGQ